jgi:hypothetical protein
MSLRKLLPILLWLTCTFAACHKKSNNNPFGSSRIATVVVSHADYAYNYRVVYDASNNVDSIILTGSGTAAGTTGFKAFTYVGSSFTITDQAGTTTVYANGSGQILKVLETDTLSMLYNGSQLAELDTWMPSLAYPYYTITKERFTWTGGDLTGDSGSGSGAYTYDYDNSKAGQPGDAWRIFEFLNYGRSFIKATHLVTDKMQSGTWVEKYQYVTDGSGRVTQLAWIGNGNGVVPNDTTVYQYTYY